MVILLVKMITSLPNKHHSRSTGHIILIHKDQRCRYVWQMMREIIINIQLGLTGGTNEFTCSTTTKIQLCTSKQTNVQTNKFINVCLLIREVEDFSVCIGVVNLCVILHVNDAVIRFLRSLFTSVYNTLYFDGQNQQKWQACFCSI